MIYNPHSPVSWREAIAALILALAVMALILVLA